MQTSLHKHAKEVGGEIARLAYGLWEQAGRPMGRDVEFWLQAERQVANANTAPAARLASGHSADARAQARRPAEKKPAGWPSPPVVKGNGRNPAKSAVARAEAPRAAA